MTIKEPVTRVALARLAGVTAQTLKNWERAGFIPPARRISERHFDFEPAEAMAVVAFAEARR